MVRKKGRRLDALPLPAAAGAAIAGYLRRGRPASNDRHVFLQHFAPHVALEGSGVVRAALQRACRRAGLVYVNPHRLRYNLFLGARDREAAWPWAREEAALR